MMRIFTLTFVLTSACANALYADAVRAQHLQSHNIKRADHLQQTPTDTVRGFNGTITLNGNSSTGVVILDYGANVEGFPTFQVVSATGDTSRLVITYSETKAVLENLPTSDGPLGLAAAMDSYRVNLYNVSGPSTYSNRLIQGAFRYQKLNLSTTGELVLAEVGVKPTTSTIAISSLPGSFECSNEDINRIWNTGARTIQLNEIPANSIPPFWQVSSEGALVQSQVPQVLPMAAELTQYEISFEVKPIANGFSFSVLADTLNNGVYIFCNIANGSISANAGSSEATSNVLALANLPRNITIGSWTTVEASINTSEIAVSLNGIKVLQFSQTSFFYGSFGLGAALGHSALYRNLAATTGKDIKVYSSTLTDESFLQDFLMGTNPINATVDGSKRDRIAYAGDLDIAVGSTFVSTNGIEYLQGTIDLLGSFQLTPGFFDPTAKIQQKPSSSPIDGNITGLIGYSFNFVTAVAGFYQRTGDAAFAEKWAPKVLRMLDWADSQVLPSSGLFNISNPAFGGDWNYYDPAQSGVVGKFNMIYAYSLQASMTLLADAGIPTTLYVSRLNALRSAINTHLWNDTLGAYYISEAIDNAFGQDTNALAILAGVTHANHTTSQVLDSLKQLSTPYGPLAFSNEALASGYRNLVSPYASGYHLRAALYAGDEESAIELLETLWKQMADPLNSNYTGCFWETLGADGTPGLGPQTSLCHAWGAGPTGELSDYVLGVTAIKPGFREWQVSPRTLGLTWARGKIPVPNGEMIVAWNASDNAVVHLEVSSPVNTSGIVRLPDQSVGCDKGTWVWERNGKIVNGSTNSFAVTGGDKLTLTRTAACH